MAENVRSMIWSSVKWLASIIAPSNSDEASRMASAVFSDTVVAPRMLVIVSLNFPVFILL